MAHSSGVMNFGKEPTSQPFQRIYGIKLRMFIPCVVNHKLNGAEIKYSVVCLDVVSVEQLSLRNDIRNGKRMVMSTRGLTIVALEKSIKHAKESSYVKNPLQSKYTRDL